VPNRTSHWSASPVGPRDLRALDYFENILPEGQTLATMASLAGVRAADTFGILAAFGRDCAGAIMLRPEPDRPDTHPTTDTCPPPPTTSAGWSTRSTSRRWPST